jgi:hypothetical protein
MKWRDRLENRRLETVDWIRLAQDSDHWWALVNSVMKIHFPLNVGILSTKWTTISFSIDLVLKSIENSMEASFALQDLNFSTNFHCFLAHVFPVLRVIEW